MAGPMSGGATTFVLIPGAGGESSYWRLVADQLRERGHQTIAIDLPADDDSAGIPDYVDVVVTAIGDRTDVVLVAQSMAGLLVQPVCELVRVRLIVLVNAMIPAAGERPGDWWANTGQAEARRELDLRDGRDPDAEFDVTSVFLHDVAQTVIDTMPVPKQQSGTPFSSSWTPGSWPDVPTRVIIGRDDRFFPAEFQRRVARERLDITADEIAGGHCLALEPAGGARRSPRCLPACATVRP